MNAITQVSQITWSDVQDYLRIAELSVDDQKTITNMIQVASAFIQSYTGLTSAQVDTYQDFVIVMFVLVQDMWDNRTLYVDNQNLNYVVEAILGMHSVNLLPSAVTTND